MVRQIEDDGRREYPDVSPSTNPSPSQSKVFAKQTFLGKNRAAFSFHHVVPFAYSWSIGNFERGKATQQFAVFFDHIICGKHGKNRVQVETLVFALNGNIVPGPSREIGRASCRERV